MFLNLSGFEQNYKVANGNTQVQVLKIGLKATLYNFDCDPLLRKTKLNDNILLLHILQRKCPLVFPLMSSDCSVCLQPFILVELPPAATWCCGCSFGLEEAYMMLSGTSVNQTWAVVGHHLRKIWPGFTQIVVLCVFSTWAELLLSPEAAGPGGTEQVVGFFFWLFVCTGKAHENAGMCAFRVVVCRYV